MLNIILTDTTAWNDLLPLSYTRPIALLRTGILTIAEKWQKISGADVSYLTQSHLKNKFPACLADDSIVVDGSILPNKHLLVELQNLPTDTSLIHNNQWIASRLSRSLTEEFPSCTGHLAQKESVAAVLRIETLADIIRLHGTQMKLDFDLLTLGRTSEKLSETNRIIGPPNNIFVEKGAKVECATFNTEAGPIYIGEDAEVMEGSIIRGPFGMGAHAVVKMGAKIYPNVSIGPHCKLGGEAGNSILYAYSNKGHDGYLGDSYIGEWCNLGADTNTSNLKNNYAEVKLWNYPKGRFAPTGLQFCGL
ncbi:MAG TPA: putative sugar nucleotidyl transferase, partial [Saprospiraceae bacterium]|nr:putative sugar nucleotidyl transferase [Saprospiraceae bacterium]